MSKVLSPEDIRRLDFGCPRCGQYHEQKRGVYVCEPASPAEARVPKITYTEAEWEHHQASEAVLFAAHRLFTGERHSIIGVCAAMERWVRSFVAAPKTFDDRRRKWSEAVRRG